MGALVGVATLPCLVTPGVARKVVVVDLHGGRGLGVWVEEGRGGVESAQCRGGSGVLGLGVGVLGAYKAARW